MQACEHYEESLTILLRLDDRLMIALYLEGLARAAEAQDEAIWAVYLVSVAQALRRSLEAAMTTLEREDYGQLCTRLHERLDEHTFATAWEKGHVMSPEQAVAARHRFMQATALSPEGKQPMMNEISPVSLHEDLTRRERDVLRLVAQGLADTQVAKRLGISRRTVNFHLTSIYHKLEVSSRSAATRYAIEYHLF